MSAAHVRKFENHRHCRRTGPPRVPYEGATSTTERCESVWCGVGRAEQGEPPPSTTWLGRGAATWDDEDPLYHSLQSAGEPKPQC